MSRCVVVGASGFVGRHLVRQLLQSKKWQCIVCVDVKPFPDVRDRAEVLECHEADVTDVSALTRIFEGASVVFHLASIVHVSLNPSPLIWKVNVDGCANVINACCSARVRTLVYTSTMDVVLDLKPVRNASESMPYSSAPPNDYARTKVIGERMALAADGRPNGRPGGLRVCALRPTHVYGEWDAHSVQKVITERRAGALPLMIGPADDPHVRTEMIYAGNVAAAHILAADALECSESANARGRPYFLCEGTRLSFWRLFEKYLQCKGLQLPTYSLPVWIMYVVCVLIELLHTALSYIPLLRGRWDPTFHLFVLYFLANESTFDGTAAKDFGYDCSAPPIAPEEAHSRTIAWVKEQPW